MFGSPLRVLGGQDAADKFCPLSHAREATVTHALAYYVEHTAPIRCKEQLLVCCGDRGCLLASFSSIGRQEGTLLQGSVHTPHERGRPDIKTKNRETKTNTEGVRLNSLVRKPLLSITAQISHIECDSELGPL